MLGRSRDIGAANGFGVPLDLDLEKCENCMSPHSIGKRDLSTSLLEVGLVDVC